MSSDAEEGHWKAGIFSFDIRDHFTQFANSITWKVVGVYILGWRLLIEASFLNFELMGFHDLVDSLVILGSAILVNWSI